MTGHTCRRKRATTFKFAAQQTLAERFAPGRRHASKAAPASEQSPETTPNCPKTMFPTARTIEHTYRYGTLHQLEFNKDYDDPYAFTRVRRRRNKLPAKTKPIAPSKKLDGSGTLEKMLFVKVPLESY